MNNRLLPISLYSLFIILMQPLFCWTPVEAPVSGAWHDDIDIKRTILVEQISNQYALEYTDGHLFSLHLEANNAPSELEHEAIGFVMGSVFDKNAFIFCLHIDEDARGKGLGTKLLTQACAFLQSKGCQAIYAELPDDDGEDGFEGEENKSRIALMNLYKKLGFKNYDDDCMQLQLTPQHVDKTLEKKLQPCVQSNEDFQYPFAVAGLKEAISPELSLFYNYNENFTLNLKKGAESNNGIECTIYGDNALIEYLHTYTKECDQILLKRACELLKSRGCKEIYIRCSANIENKIAMEVCKEMGFQVISKEFMKLKRS